MLCLLKKYIIIILFIIVIVIKIKCALKLNILVHMEY